ncbi:MAG: recombinase family protein [Pontixanthobacter sp.]
MDSLASLKCAIYARVSTTRQADNDISIPDQEAQGKRYIDERNGEHTKTYVEPGASATTTARPIYQEMLADAQAGKFDVVVTFALSRMFRNALDCLQARAEFRAAGIKLISITQDFSNDPAGELALSMVAIFDEYHSAENAKHVKRTMLENARRGYWNGQTPSLGFKTTTVPQPKGKDRKKLMVDEETAPLVRFIFNTYVHGTPKGPIGITKLAALLNERGDTIRGKKFHVSNVHFILTNTAYIGVVFFNKRDSRAKVTRPESEWVPMSVPPIIDEELFYATQAQMSARDPKMGSAAERTKKNLLTKKVKCGTGNEDGCGGGMTTATGKSGQHRYYACHTSTKGGKSECPGRWTPMDKLDDIVVESVVKKVLAPDRLSKLLEAWLDRSALGETQDRKELKSLRSRHTRLEGESASVIKLVRNQILSPDDPQVKKELGQIAAQKRAAAADIDAIERKLADPAKTITPLILAKFGKLIADTMRDRNTPLRQAYVDLLISRVEVGNDVVRIMGSKTALSRAANGTPPHAVPKTEREWCTRHC